MHNDQVCLVRKPMLGIRRREFIAMLGGAAAWPLAAHAQQGVPVVGSLSIGSLLALDLDTLLKGMREQGYVEGRNFTFEHRSTEQYDRLPALAAELVARRVNVIFTASNNNAALAAKAATTTVPIVFTIGGDPVQLGLVAGLNRPGGNVTGVTFLTGELGPKRLELLHEVAPQATTLALLVNPTNPNELLHRDMEEAARKMGLKLLVLRATTADEIDAAFATLVAERAGGLLLFGDAFFATRRNQFIVLAARHAIPAVYFNAVFTHAGGLMSYSEERSESFRQAGNYIGRILKGQKPADLPVLQSTTFEFAINLRTAKALGIESPPSFHLRATEVIE
jgi:putative ABC transport system substrate-binding protein